MIIMLIYFRKSANDIVMYTDRNPPFYAVFFSALGHLAVVMILGVLLYKMYMRRKYPRALKIILKGGVDVILYVGNPQEVMNELKVRRTSISNA